MSIKLHPKERFFVLINFKLQGVIGMLKKRVLVSLVALIMFMAFPISINAEEEELEPGQCEIRIESDKHTFTNPASATGPCNELVRGYYSEDHDRFDIEGPVTRRGVGNGEVFVVGTPKHPYGEAILTV